VPIILAMTIMEKNAADYGIEGIQLDPPLEYDTIELTAPTSLALVSDITDTPLPQLAALNPAVLRTIAPDGYSLHVPKGAAKQLVAALQMIPAERRAAWRMHRVGIGETLASIGKRYGISSASIVAANSLEADEALEGDRLLIPTALRPEPPPTTVRRAPARTPARRPSTAASSKKKPVVVARAHK